jgi:hypothetical protein
MTVSVRPISSRADRSAFVALAYALNQGDPNWVPPLRSEVAGLITPGKNPWFEHAEAQLFLAEREGVAVGRISAQVDRLVLDHMGAGTGQWGMFEAADEEAAVALLAAAEDRLRAQGMTRALGPFSLSIWDEPGLLVRGHDHPPVVMMGHNKAEYEGWIETAGHEGVKDLYTYEVMLALDFPPIVRRIVESGERNPRIRVRQVVKKRFDEEAAIVLAILNDAWSDNWGFVPLTDAEIAYAGRKLRPIVHEDLILVAEYDGEPVAFMLSLPDINEYLIDLDGRLFPTGWAKLLWRLRRGRTRGGRVALMGVVKRLQTSRLASQLAFMMIEYIRRAGIERYRVERTEIGWVLEDNAPMRGISEALGGRVNRVYRIYGKPIATGAGAIG